MTKSHAQPNREDETTDHNQQIPEEPKVTQRAKHSYERQDPERKVVRLFTTRNGSQEPHAERDDGQEGNDEGNANALQPLYRQRTQSAPLPQQSAEEAAEQEEYRHPKSVNAVDKPPVEHVAGGGRIMYGPQGRRLRQHEEAGVQHNAQHHRKGPERIEIVEALRPRSCVRHANPLP